MTLLDQIARIAELEYAAIVVSTQALGEKQRIFICDGSFIDVWTSARIAGRFGFHWERTHLDGTVFRYDNFPDINWQAVSTFPYHFHHGSQDQVEASPFPQEILHGFRAFMDFVAGQVSP